MQTQVVVIGGGPGGYAAAFLAADEGLEVTLVEREPRLGGTCLLRGCIPSKALLHVARVMAEVEEIGQDWGVTYSAPSIAIDALRSRKEQVIATLSGGLAQLAKRRKINLICGQARFENSSSLAIEGDHESVPEDGQLSFEHCIIATGSAAAMPKAFDVGSPRVMDSTGALALTALPETMLVVGGGYIGLEMGTVYAQLGTRVSVVELLDGLLAGVDRDLVRPLQKRMSRLLDDRIFLNTKVGSIAERENKIEVAFEGPGKFGTELYDSVLIAIGRRPCTDHLALENTRIVRDQHGFIQHDSQLRTDEPNIYVIGDAAGQPMLAHKATHEGRTAVEVILGKPASFEKRAIPAVVFTDPEIAWAGVTQDQAKAENRAVEVATYPWAASGRAQAISRTDGLTKWIIDPDNDRLIGCGIVGPGAGELIAEAVLAIEMGCEVRDVTESIHPHPTLSETVMNAAEVYFGTATEVYKPKRTRV